MCGVLVLLFIAVPIAEIYLLITVGGAIGALPTIAGVIAIAVGGAALARRAGFQAMAELQRSARDGTPVAPVVAEGAVILIAGIVLIMPGFLTDIAGILLLVPPLRRRAAAALIARFKPPAIFTVGMPGGPGPRPPGAPQPGQPGQIDPPPDVIDV